MIIEPIDDVLRRFFHLHIRVHRKPNYLCHCVFILRILYVIKDIIIYRRAEEGSALAARGEAYFLVLRLGFRSCRKAEAATDFTAFDLDVLSSFPAIRPTRLEVATLKSPYYSHPQYNKQKAGEGK